MSETTDGIPLDVGCGLELKIGSLEFIALFKEPEDAARSAAGLLKLWPKIEFDVIPVHYFKGPVMGSASEWHDDNPEDT